MILKIQFIVITFYGPAVSVLATFSCSVLPLGLIGFTARAVASEVACGCLLGQSTSCRSGIHSLWSVVASVLTPV